MNRESILRAFPELEQMTDKGLEELTINTWLQAVEESGASEEEFFNTLCHKSLKECPVTLVGHTRGVMQLAIKVAEQFIQDFSKYISLNMDYVISAACIHDVGKMYEHMRDEDGNITWAAKNLHHPITGAALALRMGIPPEIVFAIANHSHEGDAVKSTPLLYVIRMADDQYFRYLFFGFEKSGKTSW